MFRSLINRTITSASIRSRVYSHASASANNIRLFSSRKSKQEKIINEQKQEIEDLKKKLYVAKNPSVLWRVIDGHCAEMELTLYFGALCLAGVTCYAGYDHGI